MKQEFENFKNEIAHDIKRKGDMPFVYDIVHSGIIRQFWNTHEYAKALYLLATIDYLSREHNSPLCGDYKDLRTQKLQIPLFPNGILMLDKLQPEYGWKEKAIREAIPEYIRHNIVEGDIKNVV